MGIDLLLGLQGALGAAQWKQKQQTQGCQAGHVVHPPVHLLQKMSQSSEKQQQILFVHIYLLVTWFLTELVGNLQSST